MNVFRLLLGERVSSWASPAREQGALEDVGVQLQDLTRDVELHELPEHSLGGLKIAANLAAAKPEKPKLKNPLDATAGAAAGGLQTKDAYAQGPGAVPAQPAAAAPTREPQLSATPGHAPSYLILPQSDTSQQISEAAAGSAAGWVLISKSERSSLSGVIAASKVTDDASVLPNHDVDASQYPAAAGTGLPLTTRTSGMMQSQTSLACVLKPSSSSAHGSCATPLPVPTPTLQLTSSGGSVSTHSTALADTVPPTAAVVADCHEAITMDAAELGASSLTAGELPKRRSGLLQQSSVPAADCDVSSALTPGRISRVEEQHHSAPSGPIWTVRERCCIAFARCQLKGDAHCDVLLQSEGVALVELLNSGVLLCKLVNSLAPSLLDDRAINTSDSAVVSGSVQCPGVPPLSTAQANQNLQLVISSARCLGCDVSLALSAQQGGSCQASALPHLLVEVVISGLLQGIAPAAHPDLAALQLPAESDVDFATVPAVQLLERWLHYHLDMPQHWPQQRCLQLRQQHSLGSSGGRRQVDGSGLLSCLAGYGAAAAGVGAQAALLAPSASAYVALVKQLAAASDVELPLCTQSRTLVPGCDSANKAVDHATAAAAALAPAAAAAATCDDQQDASRGTAAATAVGEGGTEADQKLEEMAAWLAAAGQALGCRCPLAPEFVSSTDAAVHTILLGALFHAQPGLPRLAGSAPATPGHSLSRASSLDAGADPDPALVAPPALGAAGARAEGGQPQLRAARAATQATNPGLTGLQSLLHSSSLKVPPGSGPPMLPSPGGRRIPRGCSAGGAGAEGSTPSGPLREPQDVHSQGRLRPGPGHTLKSRQQRLNEMWEGTADDDIMVDKQEERLLRMWLNSLAEGLHLDSLFDSSMRTGWPLLQALEGMQPGCVRWSKAFAPPFKEQVVKIKSVQNCNQVVEICATVLHIPLVNLGGLDIAEGRRTALLSLVWQMMRHHAMRMLGWAPTGGQTAGSGPLAGRAGRPQLEEDILRWANARLAEAGHQRLRLSGFSDPRLSEGAVLLHLLAAIAPDAVKPEHILPGRTDEERGLNAKYVISLSRKLGCAVFMQARDIVDAKPKMMLMLLAALMALDVNTVAPGKAGSPLNAAAAAVVAVRSTQQPQYEPVLAC